MKSCLGDFLARLDATDSVQRTWHETTSFLMSLGFGLMMYGYATTGMQAEVETLSNFPLDYQKRYRENRYYRDDPVVRHCIGSLAPLRVGRDSLPLWPDRGRKLTMVQHRIINEAAECGMSVGIVIPLRSPGRYPLAGMSMSNAMNPTEFEHFIAEWGHVAHLAALYAHIRMQILLQEPKRTISAFALSERERECLQWVSRGLSSKEISREVSLGTKTVDYHLAKVMRKFAVSTRSHAVARAITFRLIDP